MTRLTLLMLLTVPCMAQIVGDTAWFDEAQILYLDTSDTQDRGMQPGGKLTLDSNGVIRIVPDMNFAIVELIDYWKQYKVECWNDSTRQERTGIDYRLWDETPDTNFVWEPWGNSGTDLVFNIRRVPRYYWTHREPTFPGFIEFLDKRRKQ